MTDRGRCREDNDVGGRCPGEADVHGHAMGGRRGVGHRNSGLAHHGDRHDRSVDGRATDRLPAMMPTDEIELDGDAAFSAMEPEALSGSWLRAGALSR